MYTHETMSSLLSILIYCNCDCCDCTFRLFFSVFMALKFTSELLLLSRFYPTYLSYLSDSPRLFSPSSLSLSKSLLFHKCFKYIPLIETLSIFCSPSVFGFGFSLSLFSVVALFPVCVCWLSVSVRSSPIPCHVSLHACFVFLSFCLCSLYPSSFCFFLVVLLVSVLSQSLLPFRFLPTTSSSAIMHCLWHSCSAMHLAVYFL